MMKFFMFFLFFMGSLYLMEKKMLKMLNIIYYFMMSNLMLFMFIMQFEKSNIYFFLVFDEYSFFLILLSFWLLGLMCMSVNSMNYVLSLLFFILMFFLFISFSSMNMFIFILFYEMSLVPMMFLILGWGINSERLVAVMYMLLYTLIFSLPLMFMLLIIYEKSGSLLFYYYYLNNFEMNSCSYMFLVMGFMVKMPLYSVHLWLPKAHVEAPVYGSMILAGILLKLGSYGLLRFMMMMKNSSLDNNLYYISLSLIGSLLLSFMCLSQMDMKSLVAYSSVVHMGMLMSGMMTLFKVGYIGAYIMMIAHGLCSSGLFYLVNLLYERVGSRLMYLSKGMINIMPSISMWWFLMCICNMSSPVSLNLISELCLINSMLSMDMFLFVILIFVIFFSSSYSLYLYSFSQHGNIIMFKMFNLGKVIEYLTLFLHWFPLNFLFLCIDVII